MFRAWRGSIIIVTSVLILPGPRGRLVFQSISARDPCIVVESVVMLLVFSVYCEPS